MKVASECKLFVAMIGDPISGFEVFKHLCANHCCLLENTRRCVESLCWYGDKGYIFHKRSHVTKKIDACVEWEVRNFHWRGCIVAYKENNVYNMYMQPKENKIVATVWRFRIGWLPVGSEPVKPENPEVPEEHEMQFDEEHVMQDIM